MMRCLMLSLLVLALGVAPLTAKPHTGVWQAQKSFGSAGKLWTDCTKSSDHGKIVDIKVIPNPPRRGENVSIIANTTINEELTRGMVTVTLKFGSLPYQQTFQLCDLLTDVGKHCPVSKGDLNIAVNTKIESFVPPGDYEGQALATDQNKERIFCIQMKFTLS